MENLRFIRSLRALRVQSEDQRDASCYTTKLNTFGGCTSEVHETLYLNGISLTPEAAWALGRSLPSLQVLEITGRDRRILQGKEMEAQFGGFNKPMPLCKLHSSKCLRFFPNLTELRLERLNMDENDQCGLLKSFGLIRSLTELSLCVRRWSDLDSFHYYSSKLNTFATLTQGRVEKRLKLDGRSLASCWLLNFFFLNSNDDLDAILSTDLGETATF